MNIDADLVVEIADALEVTGVHLSSPQIHQLLEGEDELIEQLDEWGPNDTDLLAQLANLLSHELIGEGWPTFGEERSGRDTEEFRTRLFAAAKANGFEVLGE